MLLKIEPRSSASYIFSKYVLPYKESWFRHLKFLLRNNPLVLHAEGKKKIKKRGFISDRETVLEEMSGIRFHQIEFAVIHGEPKVNFWKTKD